MSSRRGLRTVPDSHDVAGVAVMEQPIGAQHGESTRTPGEEVKLPGLGAAASYSVAELGAGHYAPHFHVRDHAHDLAVDGFAQVVDHTKVAPVVV